MTDRLYKSKICKILGEHFDSSQHTLDCPETIRRSVGCRLQDLHVLAASRPDWKKFATIAGCSGPSKPPFSFSPWQLNVAVCKVVTAYSIDIIFS